MKLLQNIKTYTIKKFHHSYAARNKLLQLPQKRELDTMLIDVSKDAVQRLNFFFS